MRPKPMSAYSSRSAWHR